MLLIDHPVSDADIARALLVGAAEIVACPSGLAPSSLAGLPMGYHEIGDPLDEASPRN